MQAVTAASPTGADTPVQLSSATERVAIVSSEPEVTHRVLTALRSDSMELGYRATELEDLGDEAGDAVAVILVGGSSACGGKELVRAATSRFPNVPVVLIAPLALTGIHKALDAGAAGIVLEAQLEASLPATIRAVRAGQLVAPRALRRSMVRPALSHRERQTLALVVRGLTNQQIAARLFLAESTVKTHLTSVFSKLGVGSRSEAVTLALDPDEKLGLELVGLAPPSPNGTLQAGDHA
jgi:DNA-binding NarL/FixJ family response regulator